MIRHLDTFETLVPFDAGFVVEEIFEVVEGLVERHGVAEVAVVGYRAVGAGELGAGHVVGWFGVGFEELGGEVLVLF